MMSLMSTPEEEKPWFFDLAIGLVLLLIGAYGISANVGVLIRSAKAPPAPKPTAIGIVVFL